MKRMICLLLALTMMLSLAACGTKEPPVVTTAAEVTEATETFVEIDEAVAPEEVTEEAEPETTEAPVAVSPVETVLLDNEFCTFALGAVSVSDMAGMQIAVTCVNKTQEALDFSWSNVSVCGVMYDPAWVVSVPAGQTLASQVEIDTFALETMGIPSADEITFRLDVMSSENWMGEPYVQEYLTVYPTGLTADSVIYPVREAVPSETVVLDDDNLTFIIEYVESQNLNYVVRCYMVNKTQRSLMVNWENTILNGQPVDPFWTALLAPGKSAYADVTFLQSDLKDLGIESVDGINFDLKAYDDSDWTELVNLPVFYVPVEEAALG